MTSDAPASPSPPELENLDRIRAILFGAQSTAFSEHLARIEADVAARETALRASFGEAIEALRESAEARAAAAAAEASTQAAEVAAHIEAVRAEAAALVAEARSWGRESDAALRDAFTAYARRADGRAQGTENALDALAREVHARHDRLAHAAAERDVLAALFDDAARRLRAEPPATAAPTSVSDLLAAPSAPSDAATLAFSSAASADVDGESAGHSAGDNADAESGTRAVDGAASLPAGASGDDR